MQIYMFRSVYIDLFRLTLTLSPSRWPPSAGASPNGNDRFPV